MSLYTIEYRVPRCGVPDALLPNPKRERCVCTLDTRELGTEDVTAIEKAAIATAPQGFLLHSMAREAH